MIEQHLRPKFEKSFFNPIIRALQKAHVTPNQVTLLSLLLGLATIPLLILNYPFAAAASLWLSGLGDAIDGGLARAAKKSSDGGAVLDIISDRIVEFAVIFGLYLAEPERAMTAILMLGSVLICVTSFLVVGIMTEKSGLKSFYYSPGLMERFEAFFFFTLMMLFPSFFTLLGGLFTALVMLTATIRVLQFVKAH